MKNRFKFRAWDKIEKRMFDVEMIHFCLNGGYIWDERNFDVDRQRETAYELNNCVLLQCTGLKDKSGKLIFEGDILKSTDENNVISKFDSNTGIGVVEWFEKYGFWNVSKIENSLGDILQDGFVEIIGNKYENPELLEADL
jgi:uncharacterized phage protein (TIGR01671 family)